MSLLGIKDLIVDDEKQPFPLNAKQAYKLNEIEYSDVLDSERDIATNIISVHDDPNLNPWTLRAFVIGFGLSAFGGVLGNSFAFVSHLPLKFLNSRDLLLQTSMNLYYLATNSN